MPDLGLVAERILELVWVPADQVTAQTVGSYAEAVRGGMLDEAVAATVDSADGPPRVQLQLTLDADPEEAAAVVERCRTGYAEYIRQVERWIA